MKWIMKLWGILLLFGMACGTSSLNQPPTPTLPFFMGVQMGGNTQIPTNRPDAPNNYCDRNGTQNILTPPTPFLYQPFEGSFNPGIWTAQMDHNQPIYQQNGIIATLGEIITHDISGTGLAGGTETYQISNRQWFPPSITYNELLARGYRIFAYQSPSFETYLYYDGHDGHDFAVSGKALAAASGIVVFKGHYSDTFGRVIEIYHQNTYLTRYAHLASFEAGLEVGSQVETGQPIGTVGGSAVVTGELKDNYWGIHLHFSVFHLNSNQWQVTDPFGWDPWAGPDLQTHLKKQQEDPLADCNGEVSYNLWVGGWPQLAIQTTAVAPFYPTKDRYVGGWLSGESTESQNPQLKSIYIFLTSDNLK